MKGVNAMEKETTSRNQSSDKLLKIIEFLAVQTEPIGLNEIAKGLNMNKSTVLRFLVTLSNHHYLQQDLATSKYYLTHKICALGAQVKDNSKLSNLVEPFLREISQTTGETTCFAMNQDDQLIFVNVIEAPGKTVRAMQKIGHTAPMHSSGIGKLFLTEYNETQIDDMISSIGLDQYTKFTLTTKESLTTELDLIRTNGYATDNEEWEIGTRCLAFPVYDYSKKAKYGISVTGPSARLTDDFMNHWHDYLQEESMKISKMLGF